MTITKYMEMMLFEARAKYEEAHGDSSRNGSVKCPFCSADTQESKFRMYRGDTNIKSAHRLGCAPTPYCINCPLLSLFSEPLRHNQTDRITIEDLMNDCQRIGRAILRFYEKRGE